MIYFVSGGVRSGKSRFAESYVKQKAGKRKVYVATSIPYDDEMKLRVKRHQDDRSLDNWISIERPVNLQEIIPFVGKEDVILIECLTILLSNEMFGEQEEKDVVGKIFKDICVLSNHVQDLVIVSNDIFSNASAFMDQTNDYIRNLGQLHRKIVEVSKEAYECVYGLNIMRKGNKP